MNTVGTCSHEAVHVAARHSLIKIWDSKTEKEKEKLPLVIFFCLLLIYIYINNSDSFPNQWSVLNINIQNYKSAGNTPMLSRSSQLAFDFFPVSKNIKQYYKHMEKEKENLGQKEKGNLYCITAFLYSLATKYQT